MPQLIPTWKNTMNSKNSGWSLIDLMRAAMEASYPFIEWDGNIYSFDRKRWQFDMDTPICQSRHLDHGTERRCARVSCRNSGASFYNWSTRQYYCITCAAQINSQPGQKGLCVNTEVLDVPLGKPFSFGGKVCPKCGSSDTVDSSQGIDCNDCGHTF